VSDEGDEAAPGTHSDAAPGTHSDAAPGTHADRVAVTGTPGTGKTTATRLLEDDHEVIHLNDLIKGDEALWSERDPDRDTLVADLDAVTDRLGDWSGILDSHLAHRFPVDRVVVLRCAPATLERRLRERGEPAPKAEENAEAEALDVVLSEAVAEHGMGRVYEIDATELDPEAVADAIRGVVEGEREPAAGTVGFTDYL